jgi:hypothetical protein
MRRHHCVLETPCSRHVVNRRCDDFRRFYARPGTLSGNLAINRHTGYCPPGQCPYKSLDERITATKNAQRFVREPRQDQGVEVY